MHNGCMIGAVETAAMVMIMGVMNQTMGCVDSGQYIGVGVVRVVCRGRKAFAAWQWNDVFKVLIYGMVTVQRYYAMDG